MIMSCGWGQGMDERAVATVLGEVLAGVAYLHGRNIVHRDIKVCCHVESPLSCMAAISCTGTLRCAAMLEARSHIM